MPRRIRNPFREMFNSDNGMLLLDKRLDEDPRVRRLTRRILAYHEQMKNALGSDLQIWLNLETLLNERVLVFEEAFFNFGFKHGYATGEAETLRAFDASGEKGCRAAADQIRRLILEEGLSPEAALAALLENARALALRL